MSLTSFLKLPEVKEKFRHEFKVPKLTARKELLAPPLSRRYALVGTAFDYLLRFWLQRHNENAICWPWVAENALRVLTDRAMSNMVYDLDRGELLKDEKPFGIYKDPAFEKANRLLNQARVEHERYISTGKLTEELIKTTLRLAQLDFIFRVGYIDENLGKTYQQDVQDLRKLITVVKPDLFKAKNLCLLNPTFGRASALVQGADADFLIDDMLIDIKTTKNLKLAADHFFQLIGYCILHKLGSIGDLKPKPEITKVAIYFSRYAHLEVIELRDIVNPKFVKWFSGQAKQYSKAA